MNTSKAIIALSSLLVCVASQAQTLVINPGNSFGDTARINNVQILTQRINQPQQVCN